MYKSESGINYTCAETAKFIREALKKSFPGQKFSVTSKTYSGGASIDIRWTDGYTEGEVKKVVNRFSGATFDGMIDLKSYVHVDDENGKNVHYGADYIFCHREYTDELTREVAAHVAKFYNMDTPEMNSDSWYNMSIKLPGNGHRETFTDQLREARFCYSAVAHQYIGGRFGHLPQWIELMVELQNNEPKEMTAVLGQKPSPESWYARSLKQVAEQQRANGVAAFASNDIPVSNIIEDKSETFNSGATSHARLDVFKGHPVIAIALPSGQEVSFGVNKAKAILEQIEAIKQFVKDNE